MSRPIAALAAVTAAALALVAATAGPAVAAPSIQLGSNTIEAPGGPVRLRSEWLRQGTGWSGCTAAGGNHHCYTPSDIRQAYGVAQLPEMGEGQTIVLVDSYGSPRAAQELQTFHDTFFPSLPEPNFDQVFPPGNPQRVFPFPTSEWPSSSPYVTSVGGTQLQFGWTWSPQSDVAFNADGSFDHPYFNATNTPGSSTTTNVVWNESWLPAATGGGPSVIYPLPSWQSAVESVIGGDQRGLPDVCWNAAVNGGVLVDLQPFLPADQQGFYLIGGTSAATPQVAALTALANERRESMAKAPLGNVGQRLYSLGAGAFTDVAPVHQGAAGVISRNLDSNTMFSSGGDGNAVTVGTIPGWPTLAGWDMTTGFGAPWAPGYVAALAAS